VQVGAARLTLERDGVTPPDGLLAAEETGRQALTELRRTLGLLRSTAPEPVEPLPGMDSIAVLVDRCRAAGVPVTVDGDPPERFTDLAPSLQLALHRVVQEALTNVVKHAGAVRTTLTLTREPDRVTVTVTNAPGRSTRTPGSGLGLAGMRQRARLFGGDLQVSATPDGGFTITARFPLGEDLAAPALTEVGS
jgi:signal transduction histidine kinase